MHYFGTGLTDVGIRKTVNQDSICLVISETNNMGQVVMAVVCDGIGGLEQGEVASSATTKTFSDWYRNTLPRIITSLNEELLQSEWTRLIKEMNYKLVQYGRSQGIRIGTTLTALLIIQDKYMIVQAGDSRAYLIDHRLRQVTEDHTFFNREIKAGRADRQTMLRDPRRNRITESIGISDIVHPDFYFGTIPEGDHVWMLCSDGLRHKISVDEFEARIIPFRLTSKNDLEVLAAELVSTVKDRGEKDNISVILVKANSRTDQQYT